MSDVVVKGAAGAAVTVGILTTLAAALVGVLVRLAFWGTATWALYRGATFYLTCGC